MAPYERWAGVGNVAAHLDIGKDFIYRRVKSCGLSARKAGRLLRFKLSQVDAWVEAAGGGQRERLVARPLYKSPAREAR